LAGAGDRQVPPRLAAAAVARQPNATLVLLPGFDHRCCWAARWPALLDRAASKTETN
jgi:hypothetical protein